MDTTGKEKIPDTEYLRKQLETLPEDKANYLAWYKAREKSLKEDLKKAAAEELVERRRQARKDRDLLVSLQKFYRSPNRWGGSPQELDLLTAYMEERIKVHTDFLDSKL